MNEDLEKFLQQLKELASESADSMNRADTDPISEMEFNALMAAAHAFTTYKLARRIRQRADELQAAEDAKTTEKALN